MSPSNTPTPASSTDADKAAIEAAVRAYFTAMNVAVMTGETNEFEAVILSDCPCRKFATSVADRFDGGSLVGARVELETVEERRASAGRAVVSVAYRTSAYVALSDNGSSESFDAHTVNSSLVLLRTEAGWLVQAENVLERL